MSDRESYGDVTAEYLALRGGAGLVRPGRDLVWAEGPDAVSFLDGLLSQDIAGMEPGGVARSFLLEPRGKLRALLWVLRGENEVGLAADPGLGASLQDELRRFLFRVEVALRLEEQGTCELWGPGSGEVLGTAGLSTSEGWTVTDAGIAASLPLGSLPRFLIVGSGPEGLEEAGAVPAGRIAAESVRIEAGEPVMGVDVDESTIPQETGLVDEAVSFTKGCFLGQELVARIDSRGRVNRRLAGITLAENVIPPVGAVVEGRSGEVGVVTSVGESLALRAPVGLAMIHREAEPGAEVTVRWEGGASAGTLRDLPLDDFSIA